MNQIYFHDQNVKSSLIHRRDLKRYLLTLFNTEKKQINRVDIIFCNDEFLLSLNKSFLNHNYKTDTLSFLLSITGEPLSGELYLSIDRIRENAKDLNIPYPTELLRVIIHSCLHLCGYKDRPRTASIKMEKLQERYLTEWFVSRET